LLRQKILLEIWAEHPSPEGVLNRRLFNSRSGACNGWRCAGGASSLCHRRPNYKTMTAVNKTVARIKAGNLHRGFKDLP
jgi:hypothetical protein